MATCKPVNGVIQVDLDGDGRKDAVTLCIDMPLEGETTGRLVVDTFRLASTTGDYHTLGSNFATFPYFRDGQFNEPIMINRHVYRVGEKSNNKPKILEFNIQIHTSQDHLNPLIYPDPASHTITYFMINVRRDKDNFVGWTSTELAMSATRATVTCAKNFLCTVTQNSPYRD